MASQSGATCPVCHTPQSTEHVAMLSLVKGRRTYLPHEYGVCAKCYAAQRKEFYPSGEPQPEEELYV